MSTIPTSSAAAATSPQPLLLIWDFDGVLNTYGSAIQTILETVIEHDGANIVVSNGSAIAIKDYLSQRGWTSLIDHVYGIDQHQGLVDRHKVAAIRGHIHDEGPFAFVLLVGDSPSDIQDGHDAGVLTCLYDQHQHYPSLQPPADYTIQSLSEVLDLLPV